VRALEIICTGRELDAAQLDNLSAWKVRDDKDVRTLVDAAQEFTRLTKLPLETSTITTYPDVVSKAVSQLRHKAQCGLELFRDRREIGLLVLALQDKLSPFHRHNTPRGFYRG